LDLIIYLLGKLHLLIGDNKGGIKKSELVAWYLDQIQEQINSEDDLLERKNFIEKIIERLTYHVRIKLFYILDKHGLFYVCVYIDNNLLRYLFRIKL